MPWNSRMASILSGALRRFGVDLHFTAGGNRGMRALHIHRAAVVPELAGADVLGVALHPVVSDSLGRLQVPRLLALRDAELPAAIQVALGRVVVELVLRGGEYPDLPGRGEPPLVPAVLDLVEVAVLVVLV